MIFHEMQGFAIAEREAVDPVLLSQSFRVR
jgi:hypothetical protein